MNFPTRSARGALVLVTSVLLLLGTSAPAEPAPAGAGGETGWTLTTADFSTEAVRVVGIDDEGLRVAGSGEGGAAVRVLKPDQFLSVERPAAGGEIGGKFVLHMLGGDRLGGEPVAMQGDRLVWSSPAVGEVPVPMSRLVAMAKPGQPAAEGRRTEDVVVLGNGDTVRGIVTAIADGKVEVKTETGDTLPVPMDAVAAMQFASTGAAGGANNNAGTRGYRVRLGDGSSFVADGLKLAAAGGDAGDATVEVRFSAEVTRPLPLSRVAAIEQVNGPAVFLPSREPEENVYVPLIGTEQDFPTRMNQTVEGGRDLRFGGRTFRQGIGVHSYSRLTWPLDGTYAAFRTQYAIEEDKTRADVTVRIRLDDRVVHERKNFRAGMLSPVVVVDLTGAKRLTLEVDYGENQHVDDHLTWLSPALLKTRPAELKPAGGAQGAKPDAAGAAPKTPAGDGEPAKPPATETRGRQ